MSKELSPGDMQALMLAHNADAEARRRRAAGGEPPQRGFFLQTCEDIGIPENLALFEYKPEARRQRWKWITARRFKKLRDDLLQVLERGGVEATDAASLFQLEVLKTRLEYGQWLNHETRRRLQTAADAAECTEEKIHRALWSWGALVTSDGFLYANPVSKTTDRIIKLLLTLTGATFVWCMTAIIWEISTVRCRPCVLLGAATLMVITAQAATMLYQVGPQRKAYADLLIKAGIPAVSTCPKKGRWGFLRFIQWGDPLYQST